MNQALITIHWPNVCNLIDYKYKKGSFVWVWTRAYFAVRIGRSRRAIAWVWRKVRGPVDAPYVIFNGRRRRAHSDIDGTGNYITIPKVAA